MSKELESFLNQFESNPYENRILQKKSIKSQEDKKGIQKTDTSYKYKATNMLRSKGSASFEGFIEMVSKLVCLTMEDMNVEFLPDENKHVIINPDIKLDKTYITYRLLSRLPNREIKHMAREEIIEPGVNEEEDRSGIIYGQKYNCTVQFNIFASEYKTANEVMKTFEEMIFSFTGYMKEKGIENILFKGQMTDDDFDVYRKTMSVRNLKYEIQTEDLLAIFKDKIQSIITRGAL